MAKRQLAPEFREFLVSLNRANVEYLLVGGYAVNHLSRTMTSMSSPEKTTFTGVAYSGDQLNFLWSEVWGNRTVNSEPSFTLLVTETLPPCASTIAFTRLNPSPSPRCERLLSPR